MNTYKLLNPYSNEVLAEITYTTSEEASIALNKLEQGRKIQKSFAPFERANILNNLAQLMKRDKEKIAKQITLEMGKTLMDSLVEMDRAITTVTLSSQEWRKPPCPHPPSPSMLTSGPIMFDRGVTS